MIAALIVASLLSQAMTPTCQAAIRRDLPGDAAFRRAPVGPQNFQMLEGSARGACPKEVADAWKAAMACASTRVTLCLSGVNAEATRRVRSRLGAERQRPLRISCAMPLDECGGFLAVTETPHSDAESAARSMTQVLDGEGLLQKDANFRCNAALHEAMHWARYGEDEHERAYACGQLCGGHCSGADDNLDCAVCASTELEKQSCGTRSRYSGVTCPIYLRDGACTTGTITPGHCTSCKQARWEACDGTVLASLPPESPCCATCDSQYNWRACGTDAETARGCHVALPMCQ